MSGICHVIRAVRIESSVLEYDTLLSILSSSWLIPEIAVDYKVSEKRISRFSSTFVVQLRFDMSQNHARNAFKNSSQAKCNLQNSLVGWKHKNSSA